MNTVRTHSEPFSVLGKDAEVDLPNIRPTTQGQAKQARYGKNMLSNKHYDVACT